MASADDMDDAPLACSSVYVMSAAAIMHLYASKKSRLKKRKHRVCISKYLRVRPQHRAYNSLMCYLLPCCQTFFALYFTCVLCLFCILAFWLQTNKPVSIYLSISCNFFFYSILRWSVAVSTMRRQSSRIATFLQADARPMFCWPRSASTARSQVWLGLPDGRFQSGGSPRITAATAR